MKIKVNLFLKIYTAVTVGLTVLAVIFISVFLYRYLYQAITQTSVIYNLKLELAVEPVNTELFNKIKAAIQDKQNPAETDGPIVKNPFVDVAPAPVEKIVNP